MSPSSQSTQKYLELDPFGAKKLSFWGNESPLTPLAHLLYAGLLPAVAEVYRAARAARFDYRSETVQRYQKVARKYYRKCNDGDHTKINDTDVFEQQQILGEALLISDQQIAAFVAEKQAADIGEAVKAVKAAEEKVEGAKWALQRSTDRLARLRAAARPKKAAPKLSKAKAKANARSAGDATVIVVDM